MLIAAGLPNREIAERLTLSVRAVENHIYRAMARTATTSRDELAALLPRPQGTNTNKPLTARARRDEISVSPY